MSFATIVACAAHEPDKMAGTWTVTLDVWHDYEVGDQVTVTEGSTPNEFYILNTTNPAVNNTSVIMIVTVDDVGNVTDITSSEIYDYGVPIVPTDAGGSLVFSCVGVISLNVEWLTSDLTGTYGEFAFVLTKN
ncbi:hypothetical protein [Seonamhaeicola aphaedonensis]|uniref:Lipocalin-like protein n=1 Tax=Seonamhaeicola aphaedonensis TaxID=1461338 RepID=A0A3D9HKM9_9FLAO|nr:hypothetical protein [Seonamhaeicola aphaedonensis]RED50038.1 hypothetical protein DFQ02_10158 [Seonamhaeicola aphaedonensis]